MALMNDLKTVDPEVAAAIDAELNRQRNKLELIASENFVSPAVMAAMGKGMSLGVLYKDAETLQKAKDINCVLLDKTATPMKYSSHDI